MYITVLCDVWFTCMTVIKHSAVYKLNKCTVQNVFVCDDQTSYLSVHFVRVSQTNIDHLHVDDTYHNELVQYICT